MKSNNNQFLPALTGYRAIAAWMIFVYHFFPFNNAKIPQWIKTPIFEFHMGVDMFFVLSGFLITYRYFHQTPIQFSNYMVNRVARIYPMYLLITLLVFVVWYLQNATWSYEKTLEFITSITLTKALFSTFFLSGIPQGWTLTLEELFYFTAPLYFIAIKKNKFWLYVLPIVIFAFGWILKKTTSSPENTFGFLQTNIHSYIIEFFAGIGLGLLFLKTKNQVKFKSGIFTFLGLLVITAYLFSRPYFATIFDLKSDFGRFIEMGLLSILGIAPLLWGLIQEKTVISKLLSHQFMVLLGKSSYIFYLIHKGFIPIFINDYISDNKLIIFILLNIVSIVLFTYIEEPLNHYIRKKFGKAKT